MIRTGQQLYDVLCEDTRVFINVNEDYDTKKLIDLFRNNDVFKLEALASFLLRDGDSFNQGGDEIKNYIINKIQNFMTDNPCGENPIPSLEASNGCLAECFYGYYYQCSDYEKEVLKQRLLDVFYV